MRSKEEIRKMLEALEKERLTAEPYSERKNIARIAATQALEWILGVTDSH